MGGNILREPSQAQKASHMSHFAARIEDGGLGGYDAWLENKHDRGQKVPNTKTKTLFLLHWFRQYATKGNKDRMCLQVLSAKTINFHPFLTIHRE
jgi:hypothetical protein